MCSTVKDISADFEYIKFAIEHVIESNNYKNEEIMELLTNISEYCEAKVTRIVIGCKDYKSSSEDESSDGENSSEDNEDEDEEDEDEEDEDEDNEDDDEDDNEDDEESEDEDKKPVSDYPFETWSAYSKALIKSLSTEFYGEKYPMYEKALRAGGVDDYCIVVDLVELYDENPQKILNGFINILCNEGKRYGYYMLDSKTGGSDIIDYLLSRGAKMNADMVFNWEGYEYEDDIAGNEIRAALIDAYFSKLGLTADEYVNYEAISDVDSAIEKIDMNNPYACLDVVKGDLKFKSKFLSAL